MVELWGDLSRVASPRVNSVLSPAELKALLDRLTQVEEEARILRAQIEQRLMERRRADAQDRSGQPKPPLRKHKPR
jgi:hypothetical protein